MFGEQISVAADVLGKSAPGESDIHDARTNIKRARATLRLVRNVVGEESFSREDSTLRSAARALADLRNAEVMVKTLDRLIARSDDERTKTCLASSRKSMDKAQRETRRTWDTCRSRAKAMLDAAVAQSHEWIVSDAWFCTAEAVERLYRQARAAEHHAANSADARTLHALRKRTQYLRYGLDEIVLEPSCLLNRLSRRLSRLSELLGEDHDLVLLETALRAHRAEFAHPELQALMALIEHRRTRLQARALKHAARLYHLKPKRFAVQLEAQWHRWEDRLWH
jgi:CHAD domain-containing protein